VQNGSTTIASVAYTLDAVGNRTQRVDQQGTHSYSYDNLYRLTSVTYPGPSTTSYAFDAFGNRTSKTGAGFGSANIRQPHAHGDAQWPPR
jgi:YD repeat-containing protein